MRNPDLRGIYRKLSDLAVSLAENADSDDVPQEILDFLAMASGLKPVLLLGRGTAPQWVEGAAGIARDFGFHVGEGPLWDATPFGKFPGWYRDHALAQLAPLSAVYVCADADVAREVEAVNAGGGRLPMTAEARLLGYPDCCVVAHYDRAVRYHQAIYAILRRLGEGDAERMQALLQGGAAMAPRTPFEISHMAAAFDLHPAPFGSWNRCPYCARHDDSPSAELSRRYESLAREIDPVFAQRLARGA
jgi:hypothetical protein